MEKVYRAGKGKGMVRAGYDNHSSKNGFLILPHPLINFEIQKYYQNEPGFNGVYSRDNLQKIKDATYIINVDEYSDIGTHWVALHVNNNDVTYFDSFGVKHIPKKIKTFIGIRIQANDSIMCGYFCIGFIDFMFKEKTLTEFPNLFSQNNFKKNDDIILSNFKNE